MAIETVLREVRHDHRPLDGRGPCNWVPRAGAGAGSGAGIDPPDCSLESSCSFSWSAIVFPPDREPIFPPPAEWWWIRALRCLGGIAEVVLASDIAAAASWFAALTCVHPGAKVTAYAATATPLTRCFIRLNSRLERGELLHRAAPGM